MKNQYELTNTEARVLYAASYGDTNEQIARRLNLTPATVKTHFWRIGRRWSIHTRTGQVAYALRSGLIR